MSMATSTIVRPTPEWADEVEVDFPDEQGQARYFSGMTSAFVTEDGYLPIAMQRQEDRRLDGTVANTDTVNIAGRPLTPDQARILARNILQMVDRFDGIGIPTQRTAG